MYPFAEKGCFARLILSVSVLPVAVAVATNGTEDAVTNVALHKETLQSHLTQYDSSIVADGNTDQYVANGSCINIEKKGNSWWQVDLGDIYTIFHIRVFLAKDCCDDIVDEVDCYETPWTYDGKTNTTVSGRTCQRWDTKLSHIHMYMRHLYRHNYCRAFRHYFFHHNAEYNKKPWCYTTDSTVKREYCDVDECETVTTDDLNLKTGTQVKAVEIPDYQDITDPLRHVRDFVLPSNSRARYVEFHQDGTTDYYPLCEVEVYGVQDDVTNVALRKTAEMSTINQEHLFDESLGIDGISDQYMLKESCFETAEEDNPWWRVDLFDIYVIFLVRLYNRLDCCSDSAYDVQLRTGPSLDTMAEAVFVEGQIEDVQNIVLPVNTEARLIELIRKGWGFFHLCEVEVFGKKAECKYDPCQNGGNCPSYTVASR
ncbi:uncharacterized protein LOC128547225 [Mercenaria mercenaria]|uniref:uncharacterized protein LOC128547225 n=1 Tax=Mercenaria mercenaria TaxID=6596 RepID=UPI00234FA3E7|nr:uncharacterized protein LOC128547225 [Mercenaria mercenaria]